MNAPLNATIQATNSFTAKILRNNTVESFNANYFNLKREDYPELGGKQWVFTAEHIVRIDETRIDTKTITLIFPEETEGGTFFIPAATKGLKIDYIDTADAEPCIHSAFQGTVFLAFIRKGDEINQIDGNFDITVEDTDGGSFKISGQLSYDTAII
ncbi:hypothetical protein ATI02_6336 [Pseudomonas baetica]|uniref:Uncharacterized protein n=1 Tax=Pseudomonas baetica TaxID=674054 RepID=A0ABX4Q8T9_9PSED|nr:hypothetical protein [Pseudomonas baetica]MDR9861459.1 hypothetical protein [Pseudomonas baetica]PKA73214.1 hypothetical protein ATI02_6336 [Pseudomonas baetica]PTC18927.1 hypothetical protein C0J26_15095 [Pseudomonas baetica]